MIRLPCDQCAATGYMPARTGETPQASAPIGREEWCRRFVDRLTRDAPPDAVCPIGGQPLKDYAEEIAEAWLHDHGLETPEECAASEECFLRNYKGLQK